MNGYGKETVVEEFINTRSYYCVVLEVELYDKWKKALLLEIYFLADVNFRFKSYLHALDIPAKGNQLQELFLLVNRVALRSHIDVI